MKSPITPFTKKAPKDRVKPAPNLGALDNAQKASISVSDNASIATAPGEKLIPGPDNTYISLGRDRPGEVGTGPQYTSAGAIYICAGASYSIPDKTPKGENGELLKAQRNGNLDASFIYMSAAAGDGKNAKGIDDYYNIAPGKMGRPEGSAAIVVKSDSVRVLSRYGIKLVTRTDPKNANGAPIPSVSGIELIAGNDSAGLQPMVKGDNLTDALSDLSEIIHNVIDTLQHFIKAQADFNTALAEHTHPDAVNILFGLVTSGNPATVTGGKTLQDIKTKIQGQLTTSFMVGSMLPDIDKHKLNLDHWDGQYIVPGGPDYVCSRYNKVN
jgi:hypothetical protein